MDAVGECLMAQKDVNVVAKKAGFSDNCMDNTIPFL